MPLLRRIFGELQGGTPGRGWPGFGDLASLAMQGDRLVCFAVPEAEGSMDAGDVREQATARFRRSLSRMCGGANSPVYRRAMRLLRS